MALRKSDWAMAYGEWLEQHGWRGCEDFRVAFSAGYYAALESVAFEKAKLGEVKTQPTPQP